MSALASKTGKAKLDEVTSLLEKLRVDLNEHNLTPQQRKRTLEELKIYGRNPENANPMYERPGIETLARHAFDNGQTDSSQEALRCLANAMWLKEHTRQLVVNMGCAPKAAERLKSDSVDDEFLAARILFLMTYNTNASFLKLVNEHHLAESINQCLERHARRYTSGGGSSPDSPPMNVMALTETCKLLFNIVHFNPDLTHLFSPSIPNLLTILRNSKIPTPPLQQPVSAVINALMNLKLDDNERSGAGYEALFPKDEPATHAEHLINILSAAISSYPPAELDDLTAPLITLLRQIYALAPDPVQRTMQSHLLPSDSERSQPLGTSSTLASRLLRLSTSGKSPALRTSISALLFELSGADPARFVRNVGYGFAAGFLMSQRLPVPDSARQPFSAGADDAEINPVTGQRRDAEPVDSGPPMMQEEKEREAERLFVLFERLKATGVVDVKNPVQQAVEEGRFEELPDD